MMKFVLLVAVCAFGFVSCETHNQRKAFSDRLIGDIEDAAEEVKQMLKHYDQNTEEGKYLIQLNANTLNYDVNEILNTMQYTVTSEGQSMALQEVVLKLNSITYELEQSFKNGAGAVKSQLQKSVEDIVVEAKNLRQIIRENGNKDFGSIVVWFIDYLVSAVQELVTRDAFQGKSKEVVKHHIQVTRKLLTQTLARINSTDENVRQDIADYNSMISSVIDETKMGLREFAFSFKTDNDAALKEIIYSLSKIVEENDEVSSRNENSFQANKAQLHVTLVNLAEQLNKIVDASYSDDGNLADANLMYGVLPFIFTLENQLHRDFEKTINNYIRPQSDEY